MADLLHPPAFPELTWHSHIPEGWIGYEYDVAMGYMTRAYTTNSDIRYGYVAWQGSRP